MPSPVPAERIDPLLPRVAGGFRLLRELGRGGMGVVYHAEELSSGRAVALKVLAADLSVSEEAFERFRRESRLAASISDSRCVFVYGAHQVEGSPAIAMELCLGETLQHRLAKGEPIAIETAVRWTVEILEGLEAAQRAGVVHRDVKPSNCFITHDDHVKVGDFGLSRSLDGDVRLTQSGAFLGSPLYASPEQIKGREVDLRSDIYSCGATLYAMLSGSPPYGGQNIGEVLARILSEDPPPLRAARAEIPPELEKVVARAMEREPERRFQDHASFRAALEPFVASEVIPAGRSKRAIAFVLDQVLLGSLRPALVFASAAQGWRWAELDPEHPERFKSLGATFVFNALPVVYYGLCEGLAGATAAKWLLGLRVVDVRTRRANLGRSLARSAVFFGPRLVVACVMHGIPSSQQTFAVLNLLVAAMFYLVMASSMRRRNGYRGLHELASGTRVLQARSPFARAKDTRPVPVHEPESTDAWPAEVGPYRLAGTMGPTPTGALLQCVDPDLNRAVWVYARRGRAATLSEERRSLARPARLRWLDSVRGEDATYEVFEAPGGSSLSASIARGTNFDWPSSQRWLSSLAYELTHLSSEGERGRACIEQLWIDRTWNPRFLDEPVGTGDFRLRTPLELLCDAAKLVLQDRAQPRSILPAGLPGSAEEVVRKLLGQGAPFASIEDASRELAALGAGPMKVSAPTRAAQILVSALVPGLLLLASILTMFVMAGPIDRQMEGMRAMRQLQAQETTLAPPERMEDEDRRAREIVIADVASDRLWSMSFVNQMGPAQLEIHKRAIAAHPAPPREDVEWARERIRARPFPALKARVARDAELPNSESEQVRAQIGPHAELSMSPDEVTSIREERWQIAPVLTAGTAILWGVASLLCALIFRGGLSLRLFGIAVRDRRGELASRLRCAWRSLLVSLPIGLLYAVGAALAMNGHIRAATTSTVATALIHALAVAYAISRPSRGIQDRWAGTRLVPR